MRVRYGGKNASMRRSRTVVRQQHCEHCGRRTKHAIEQRFDARGSLITELCSCSEHRFFGVSGRLQFRTRDGWDDAPADGAG